METAPQTIESQAEPAGPLGSLRKRLEAHDIPWSFAVNTAAFMGVLALACLAVVGSVAYRGYSTRKAERIATELQRTTGSAQLKTMLERYSSARIAPLILLKLGQAQFAEQNYDAAFASFNKFIETHPEHPLLEVAKFDGIMCMEARNETEAALQAFREFGAANPDSYLRAEAMFAEARCLEQLGRPDEARRVYEDYLVANPKGTWTERAERNLHAVKIALARTRASP